MIEITIRAENEKEIAALASLMQGRRPEGEPRYALLREPYSSHYKLVRLPTDSDGDTEKKS